MGGQWHGWDVLETVRSARRPSRNGTRETQVKSECRRAQHRDPRKLEDGVICHGCVWKQLAAAGHGHVFTFSWGCLGSTLFLIGPTGSPDMQGGSVTCAMSRCLDLISVPSCPAVFSPWAVGRWRPGVAFRTKERRKLGALPPWGTGTLPPHPSANCPILPPFYLPPLGKPWEACLYLHVLLKPLRRVSSPSLGASIAPTLIWLSDFWGLSLTPAPWSPAGPACVDWRGWYQP